MTFARASVIAPQRRVNLTGDPSGTIVDALRGDIRALEVALEGATGTALARSHREIDDVRRAVLALIHAVTWR